MVSKKKNSIQKAKRKMLENLAPVELVTDLRLMIEQTRNRVAHTVSTELVSLYWHIGKRINADILKNKRAEYGEEIVSTLSQQLTLEYGKGYSKQNLFHFIRFAATYSDVEIVSTLSRQLSWSHFKEIIYLEDDLKRDFYAELCRVERWSVRTLRDKIGGMLYERTALSKKPEKLIKQELDALRETDKLTPDLIFRDTYFLDFLGLRETYSEKDLEDAILLEIEKVLLEFGKGFCFVARQKRISIGKKDYYLDLLFYHRGLRRLVVIELKLEGFKPEHKGQIELYLRWLDKHERQEGEESPIGLILCADAEHEEIELLELDKGSIRVAEYLTELPPREVLQAKLQQAITLARQRH